MSGRILPNDYPLNYSTETHRAKQQSIHQSQELIYQFLINLVKKSPPETVLLEFKNLFFLCELNSNSKVIQALYQIIFRNHEGEFRNTLKRSAYILINNWSSKRQYNHIQELIQLLTETGVNQRTLSPSLNRLRIWLANFINSEGYQELKLFVSHYTYTPQGKDHWVERYTSYLLVPQYIDSQNPIEQRESARNLAKRLKEKFKFDLAMYTARCDSPRFKDNKFSNPTSLGTGVISLIKKVVSKNLLSNYRNYAHRFLKETRNLNYGDFKKSIQKYLIFYISSPTSLDSFNKQLSEKLGCLYESHNDEKLSGGLLLRTCRQIVEFLTTEDGQKPSFLFSLLSSQESPLTIAILFLKIILICKYVHTHLEVCIAKLIRYYAAYPEKDCQWFINFLEIFNIVFTIYSANVQYNLVKVKDHAPDSQRVVDLDAYRIFSQLKGANLRGANLSGANLIQADLKAADLRDANLSGADLTQADLSLAKLSRANLSGAILTGAKLSAADLNSTDLTGASLSGADLRRADLRQAKLSNASLKAIKLHRTKLQPADLSSVSLNLYELTSVDLESTALQPANLSDANLSGADLRHTTLIQANLSGADLHHANLSNANLTGANLSKANLNQANLNGASLRDADLKNASLRCTTLSAASLSRANLSRADLSYAQLSNSNLSFTNLSYTLLRHVNLNGTDLSHADLNGTNLFSSELSRANVKGAYFRENSTLSEETRLNLKQRGAIVEMYSKKFS